MSHKQDNLPIKFAEIDKSIAPIVIWLNSLMDVSTLYSCEEGQRTDDFGAPVKPYVMFFCRHQEILLHIITFLDSGVTIEIHKDPGSTTLLYTARFDDHDTMVGYAELLEAMDEEDDTIEFEFTGEEGEA